MFFIPNGSPEENKELISRWHADWAAVRTGHVKYWVPLNGGSDTRRAAREYWQEFAESLGLHYECAGNCIVTIRSKLHAFTNDRPNARSDSMGHSMPKHSKRSAALNGYYQRTLKQERKERRTAFILAPDFVKVGTTSGSTALSFALGQACARELDKLGFDTKKMREHVLTHVPLAPAASPVAATAMAG